MGIVKVIGVNGTVFTSESQEQPSNEMSAPTSEQLMIEKIFTEAENLDINLDKELDANVEEELHNTDSHSLERIYKLLIDFNGTDIEARCELCAEIQLILDGESIEYNPNTDVSEYEDYDSDNITLEDKVYSICDYATEEGFRNYVESLHDDGDSNVSLNDLDNITSGNYSSSESEIVNTFYDILGQYLDELDSARIDMYPNGEDLD